MSLERNDGDRLVPIAVTLPIDLLEQIDERIRELDLNRSQYFRRLVREDLAREQEEMRIAP